MNLGVRERILAWFVGILPFCFFWLTGLFDVDEGFYGAAIRGMLETGNWILPQYRGEPWLEKPILLYWLAAPSVAVFGEVIGPRLPSVLASIGTIFVCYRFALARWGAEAAVFVPIIFGGSILFVVPGNLLLADPPMTFFLTATFLLIIQSIGSRPKLAWAAGATLGMAILAKGPVALFFVLAVLAWSYAADREYRKRYINLTGPILAASTCVSCIWFIPAYLASPQVFVDEFVIRQNLMRLAGGDLAHGVWGWAYIIYYIVVLGVAFAPWWWFGMKGTFGARTTEEKWLVRWFAVVLILFTLSGSKLPHYILPATVPLGLLAAKHLSMSVNRKRALVAGWSLCLLSAGLMALMAPKYYTDSGQREAHKLVLAVRNAGGQLWTYRLRPLKRKIGPQVTLQESNLPSLEFYYWGIREVFEESDFVQVPLGGYVFTRSGRISDDEAGRFGLREWRRGYTGRYIVYRRQGL